MSMNGEEMDLEITDSIEHTDSDECQCVAENNLFK